jgi:hypothetical protein
MTKLGKGEVLPAVGAAKSGFIFRSDARRKNGSASASRFQRLMVHHFRFDPRERESLYAATRSECWGSDTQRSRDGGPKRERTKDGLRYAKDSGDSLKCIRHIHRAHPDEPETLYAGVDWAGLFGSDDRGVTWTAVESLDRHQARSCWNPGKGGLIRHSIVPDPHDKIKMHVAISAAGVFYTEDGGRSWQPRNRGTRADFLPDKHLDLSQCVHKLLPAADGRRLYQPKPLRRVSQRFFRGALYGYLQGRQFEIWFLHGDAPERRRNRLRRAHHRFRVSRRSGRKADGFSFARCRSFLAAGRERFAGSQRATSGTAGSDVG